MNFENSSHRAVFYFLSLFIYGTCPIIVPAGSQDTDLIISMRSGNNKNLKPLEIQYIQQHIHEFIFVVLNGEKVGIMRLFTPPNCPDVIEMGSFVKVSGKGSCTTLVKYAEQYAENLRKTVIAITHPIEKDETGLAAHLKRLGWELGTQEKYKSRKEESPRKILWQNPAKRLDSDSLQSYL